MSQSSEYPPPGKVLKSKIRWPAILSTILFQLVILFAGYFFYVNQKNRLTTRVEQDLNAISDLKIQNLAQWIPALVFR